MAATWDVAAMKEWGIGMGKEFYAKGANVQLGPGLCLARVPRNGRNFEYLSGEDPKHFSFFDFNYLLTNFSLSFLILSFFSFSFLTIINNTNSQQNE